MSVKQQKNHLDGPSVISEDETGGWTIPWGDETKKIILAVDLPHLVCERLKDTWKQSYPTRGNIYDDLNRGTLGVRIEDVKWIYDRYAVGRRNRHL